MNSSKWLFAAAMSISSLALAQTSTDTAVTESTDPAKIAEIEQHAQELASRAQATPATGERDHAKKSSKHHKNKPKQKDEMKDKAPTDTPPATDSKD